MMQSSPKQRRVKPLMMNTKPITILALNHRPQPKIQTAVTAAMFPVMKTATPRTTQATQR